jgi:hypothetical protein
MRAKYGAIATMFKTGEFPEDVLPEEPLDLNTPEGRIYLGSISEISKRRVQNEHSKRLMYADLWMALPRTLRDVLTAREDHDDAIDTPCDVKLLWQRVGALATAGVSRMAAVNQLEHSQKFAALRQRQDESLGEFKTRVKRAAEMFIVLGMPEPENSLVVLTFVNGASDETYGEAKRNLKYLMSEGFAAVPESLESAFMSLENRATQYNNQYRRGPASATFAAKQYTNSASSPPPYECRICAERGEFRQMHWHNKCPNREKTMMAVYVTKGMTKPPSRSFDARAYDHGHEDPREDRVIRLDTQSDRHVFHNEDLLDNIKPIDPVPIMGIGNHVVLCTNVGSFGGVNDVLVCERTGANILSFALMRDEHEVSYDSPTDTMRAVINGETRVFHRIGNHYEYTMPDTMDKIPDMCMSLQVPTTRDLEAQYTRDEVSRFRKAGDAIAALGYPSPKRLFTAIKYGVIENLRISEDDIRGYLHIYGNVPFVKGRATDFKIRPRPYVPIYHDVQRNQKLHADIMFLNGEPFLITVSEPLRLLVARKINGRDRNELQKALAETYTVYRSRRFIIDELSMDQESAVKALQGVIGDQGIVYNPVAPSVHDHMIERNIRTVKDTARSVLASLPYDLPPSEYQHLVSFCVSRLNMLPSEARVDPSSPLQLFTGRKPDAETLGPPFGVYCLVNDPVKTNSMQPKTMDCICLGGNSANPSIIFLNLESMQNMVSVKYKQVTGIPEWIIHKMNDRAKAQKRGTDRTANAISEKAAAPDANTSAVQRPVPTKDPTSEEIKEPTVQAAVGDEIEEPTVTTTLDKDRVEDPPPPSLFASKCYRIHCEDGFNVWSEAHSNTPDRCYNISFGAAVKSWGDQAAAAARSELQSMLRKNVFEPAKPNVRKTIMSFMFFKAKHDANGKFLKLKARLVAGGHQQNRLLYEDVSSPTCSLHSLFLVSAIAAKENRVIATMDIASAYLNADMERQDIFMTLDHQLMDILTDLDPSFKECRRQNGMGVVRLKKALYGCLESALLWYRHINQTLVEAGYHQNEYDKCVYSGHGCILLIYVDDVFIAAGNDEDKSRVVKVITDKYKEVTLNDGPVQNYLGMEFVFRDGLVEVSMNRHVEEIIQGYEGPLKNTPSTATLFQEGDTPLLSDKQREVFHSMVAKMLFSAKRVRPDILTAVAFLTTRVQQPSELDWKKMEHIKGYVKGTKNRKLTLAIKGEIQLKFAGDSAFDVHKESKSHSGSGSGFDYGIMSPKSYKQKSKADSSTESEMATLSDVVHEVAWSRMFMFCLGYPQKATVVYQDNKSTIMLAENGPTSSGKSKHFRRKYFGVREMIEHGEVKLVYLPTEEMFVDALTKPITGQLFHKMTSRLQGECPMVDDICASVEEPC